MVKNHLKRIATPRTWSFLRKQHMFISKPMPGAHGKTHATSMNSVMKEILNKATTTKEVKRIIKEQEVTIDGKRRYDEKFNVGFMDVITFPKEKQSYRILFNTKGKLFALESPAKEANLKVSKIIGKKTVKNGKTQVHLNDSRNILIEKDAYAVGDSLLIEVPQQMIKEHLPLKEGAAVIVYKGKYIGTQGVIQTVEGAAVVVKTAEGSIHTRKDYAYVVGDKKPAIKCSP